MTLKDLDNKLDKFIDNEFKHLRTKVDWIFYTLIGGLVTVVTGLVIMICKGL